MLTGVKNFKELAKKKKAEELPEELPEVDESTVETLSEEVIDPRQVEGFH